MRIVHILPLLIASILAYFVLYSPQPLFPLLSVTLNLSETQTALLTTATMVPLFFAPLTFGQILSSHSPEWLLRISLILLSATTLGFVLVNEFTVLLMIRFAQGLLLPVLLTSVMTLISKRAGVHSMQIAMSYYVTATILGGLLGRLISGAFADYGDWRTFFYLLTASLFLMSFVPLGSSTSISDHRDTIHWRDVRSLLADNGLGWVFLAVSCLFFVFSAMMNFLPFRVGELMEEASGLFISLMYSGYVLGVASSLLSSRISLMMGGGLRTMLSGFIVYGLAVVLTVISDIQWLFAALFLFCGAMFLVHSIATGFVNSVAGEKRRLVNALYLTFYYLGGMLGSFIPGVIYEYWGWAYFVLSLLFVCAVGWGAITMYSRKNPRLKNV